MKKYVISLERRPDRLKQFYNRCPYKDVEYFPGFDGKYINANKNIDDHMPLLNFLRTHVRNLSVGQYGCFMSHIILWKKMIDEGHDYIMIFEDDAQFCDDFLERMDVALENLKMIDTILYIGGRFVPNFVMENCIEVNDSLVKNDYKQWINVHYDRTTHAYIISKECCKFLLGAIANTKHHEPVDHYMMYTFREFNIDVYSSKPLLCHSPLFNDSDIK